MAVLSALNVEFEKYNGLIGTRNIVLLVVAVLIAKQCYTIFYNLYLHPLRKIPGPQLWVAFPILRSLHMVRGQSEFRIRELHEKYGEVLRVSANEVYFTNAQAWKDIYGHGHAEFPKYYPEGIHMDPRKIISSNARDHFRYRRAMLPAFSDKALVQQEPLIRVYVDLLMKRLGEVAESGDWTNMVRWYNLTTFDLIADLAYGESLNGLESGQSNGWIDNIEKVMVVMPVFVLLGTSKYLFKLVMLLLGPVMRKAQESHMANVTKLANGRLHARKQPDRGDFMDYFLRSRGQAHGLTDDEVIINSDLIMVAGSETTATLLSGATYLLLSNPHTLKLATQEVRSVFSSDDQISFVEAGSKLPYLNACLEEALRLFPPVPLALARSVPGDIPMEVCGLMMPPKTTVGVHHLSTYTSEHNFHRAREYLPERWLPRDENDTTSPFLNDRRDAFKPFSFGPRDCIGRQLARHEMRIIMAKLLFHFDLRLDESCKDWYNQPIFSLWEKPTLKVYLSRRKD
ncbi:cytochrome P450 [Pestalotiopsis sp. NC0098]|nr:cytochrome P450 [Pestalotiopsis sp. NC0098]